MNLSRDDTPLPRHDRCRSPTPPADAAANGAEGRMMLGSLFMIPAWAALLIAYYRHHAHHRGRS
jgi:hypothetical protein